MIGVPEEITPVERGLRFIGLIGTGFGLLSILIAVGAFLFGFIVAEMRVIKYFYVFTFGVKSIVVGLFLSAFGQALGSFRLIAHNINKRD